MSFRPRADLYIDVDRWGGARCLLNRKTSSLRDDTPEWTQGDLFDLGIWFRRQGGLGQASTAVDMEAPSMVLAGKVAGAGAIVVFEDGFAQEGTGDDLCYVAEVDCGSSELATALASTSSANVVFDLEVQVPGNTARITWRFTVELNKQIYSTGEAEPAPAAPEYPSPGNLVVIAPANGNLRVRDGKTLQLLDPESNTFHTLRIRMIDGIRRVECDQTGEAV